MTIAPTSDEVTGTRYADVHVSLSRCACGTGESVDTDLGEMSFEKLITTYWLRGICLSH